MDAPEKESGAPPPGDPVEHMAREVLFRAQKQTPTPECHVNVVQCVLDKKQKNIPFRSINIPTDEFVSKIPWGKRAGIMPSADEFPALVLDTQAIPGFKEVVSGKRTGVFVAIVDVHEKKGGGTQHLNTFQIAVPWEEAKKQIASIDAKK